MTSKNTIDVVAGILHRGRRILLGQRKPDQVFPNCWEFPGGKVEPGETEQEALCRELKEELAIEATIGPRLLHYRHHYSNEFSPQLSFFLVTHSSPALTNLNFADLRWIPLEQLAKYPILQGNNRIVTFLLEHQKELFS